MRNNYIMCALNRGVASVQQKALIFQTTRTLIRRLCFTLYHASVQQKVLIFVSQNDCFIVYI